MRDTAVLNSDIICGVIAEVSTPFSLAKDFCSDPRWSIAAAAMTPFESATALIPFNLPAVIFNRTPSFYNGCSKSQMLA